jgi:uncharacterized protein YjbI with pentapeptide repeats
VRAANVPVPQLPVVQAWRAGTIAVINDVYGAVQTWIASVPASPIRDFLHQGVVSVRATALSVVGIRVGATPSCVSTGDCSYENFTSYNLSGLYAPGVKFKQTVFSRAGLKYASLNYADLTGADLSYADLSYANLSYAAFGDGEPNVISSLYTNLTSANLSSANLTYAQLSATDLTDTDLSFADLSHAHLKGAILTYVTWYKTTCPNGTVTNTRCTA